MLWLGLVGVGGEGIPPVKGLGAGAELDTP